VIRMRRHGIQMHLAREGGDLVDRGRNAWVGSVPPDRSLEQLAMTVSILRQRVEADHRADRAERNTAARS
jgi:hypothetical protein